MPPGANLRPLWDPVPRPLTQAPPGPREPPRRHLTSAGRRLLRMPRGRLSSTYGCSSGSHGQCPCAAPRPWAPVGPRARRWLLRPGGAGRAKVAQDTAAAAGGQAEWQHGPHPAQKLGAEGVGLPGVLSRWQPTLHIHEAKGRGHQSKS